MASKDRRRSTTSQAGSDRPVTKACILCREAKLKCDDKRPCPRCVMAGRASQCVDYIPRPRGRKRQNPPGTTSSTSATGTAAGTVTPPGGAADQQHEQQQHGLTLQSRTPQQPRPQHMEGSRSDPGDLNRNQNQDPAEHPDREDEHGHEHEHDLSHTAAADTGALAAAAAMGLASVPASGGLAVHQKRLNPIMHHSLSELEPTDTIIRNPNELLGGHDSVSYAGTMYHDRKVTPGAGLVAASSSTSPDPRLGQIVMQAHSEDVQGVGEAVKVIANNTYYVSVPNQPVRNPNLGYLAPLPPDPRRQPLASVAAGIHQVPPASAGMFVPQQALAASRPSISYTEPNFHRTTPVSPRTAMSQQPQQPQQQLQQQHQQQQQQKQQQQTQQQQQQQQQPLQPSYTPHMALSQQTAALHQFPDYQRQYQSQGVVRPSPHHLQASAPPQLPQQHHHQLHHQMQHQGHQPPQHAQNPSHTLHLQAHQQTPMGLPTQVLSQSSHPSQAHLGVPSSNLNHVHPPNSLHAISPGQIGSTQQHLQHPNAQQLLPQLQPLPRLQAHPGSHHQSSMAPSATTTQTPTPTPHQQPPFGPNTSGFDVTTTVMVTPSNSATGQAGLAPRGYSGSTQPSARPMDADGFQGLVPFPTTLVLQRAEFPSQAPAWSDTSTLQLPHQPMQVATHQQRGQMHCDAVSKAVVPPSYHGNQHPLSATSTSQEGSNVRLSRQASLGGSLTDPIMSSDAVTQSRSKQISVLQHDSMSSFVTAPLGCMLGSTPGDSFASTASNYQASTPRHPRNQSSRPTTQNHDSPSAHGQAAKTSEQSAEDDVGARQEGATLQRPGIAINDLGGIAAASFPASHLPIGLPLSSFAADGPLSRLANSMSNIASHSNFYTQLANMFKPITSGPTSNLAPTPNHGTTKDFSTKDLCVKVKQVLEAKGMHEGPATLSGLVTANSGSTPLKSPRSGLSSGRFYPGQGHVVLSKVAKLLIQAFPSSSELQRNGPFSIWRSRVDDALESSLEAGEDSPLMATVTWLSPERPNIPLLFELAKLTSRETSKPSQSGLCLKADAPPDSAALGSRQKYFASGRPYTAIAFALEGSDISAATLSTQFSALSPDSTLNLSPLAEKPRAEACTLQQQPKSVEGTPKQSDCTAWSTRLLGAWNHRILIVDVAEAYLRSHCLNAFREEMGSSPSMSATEVTALATFVAEFCGHIVAQWLGATSGHRGGGASHFLPVFAHSAEVIAARASENELLRRVKSLLNTFMIEAMKYQSPFRAQQKTTGGTDDSSMTSPMPSNRVQGNSLPVDIMDSDINMLDSSRRRSRGESTVEAERPASHQHTSHEETLYPSNIQSSVKRVKREDGELCTLDSTLELPVNQPLSSSYLLGSIVDHKVCSLQQIDSKPTSRSDAPTSTDSASPEFERTSLVIPFLLTPPNMFPVLATISRAEVESSSLPAVSWILPVSTLWRHCEGSAGLCTPIHANLAFARVLGFSSVSELAHLLDRPLMWNTLTGTLYNIRTQLRSLMSAARRRRSHLALLTRFSRVVAENPTSEAHKANLRRVKIQHMWLRETRNFVWTADQSTSTSMSPVMVISQFSPDPVHVVESTIEYSRHSHDLLKEFDAKEDNKDIAQFVPFSSPLEYDTREALDKWDKRWPIPLTLVPEYDFSKSFTMGMTEDLLLEACTAAIGQENVVGTTLSHGYLISPHLGVYCRAHDSSSQ